MIIAHIEGATRICGKAQGYLGLPLRDELISDTVNGEGTPAMVTAWTPTPEELAALNSGASVHVRILGTTPPPMMVLVGPAPEQSPPVSRSSAANVDRETAARAIRSALTEEWTDADNCRRWDEDVLLTGCRKVGAGSGYSKPEEAAQNLALMAADAVLALITAVPQPTPETEEFLPRDAWNELVHKDDRTSPEDYPDMCLISFDELKDYMERHTSPLPRPK